MKDRILEFMTKKAYKPLTREELIAAFEIRGPGEKEFNQLLAAMEAKGLIIRTRWGGYGVPQRMNLVVGRIQGNAKGFAFVIPDFDEQEDVYIAPADTNGAMHNDRVVVRLLGKNKGAKSEGEVIRILEHYNITVVGTFDKGKQFSFVIPDETRINYDILVNKEDYSGAVNNEKVVVEITRWPEGRKNPEGRIIQRLGSKDAPGTDILSIIYQHGLPLEFPEAVLSEAKATPEYVQSEDIKGRTDFRGLDIVTIDGAEARDLDDAINVIKTDTGYRLGVHIADVTHYVRPGAALDKEAENRGTSVYLVDRVIPMLPEQLSNGICSLNPKQDRLTTSLVMDIDMSGRVTDYKLSKGVIRTKERMTYDEVFRILRKDDPALLERYSDLVPQFRLMEELAEILGRNRTKRGAIDFDFTETEVELDAQGKPVAITPRSRTIADKIIEEFMLVANETVARHFASLDKPFVYRIHEKPAADKIKELNDFLHNFGYHIKGSPEDIHPKALQQLLEKASAERFYRLVSTVTLRSLRQARYSDQNAGHFGLASEYYTHFTAPIRRYPDLLVHRFIAYWLGEPAPRAWKAQLKDLKELAAHCSRRERGAEEADRESVDLKKVEYMEAHLGEIFSGIISGVTAFGLFVELENSVEGLVHISNMHDDYYHYNEKLYSLVGERKKQVFRLADPVTVKLIKVNKEARTLDFLLVQE
ncbi:MAG: ribonuclease R [Eubacteriales bacterium]|nr:ribonuclease R [Eubacteriales bacterium]MDD4079646.1 ribonuclease R [Eubacteriales bacterium]MDD4769633.1 ribonuclease R [Eubacteriales bacterium]